MGLVETTKFYYRSETAVRQLWLGIFAIWVSRLAVGGVFLFAATLKIADPDRFAEDIFNYQILADSMINPVAILLPWLEAVMAITLLMAPAHRKTASICLIMMLVVFVFAQISVLTRGLHISCGCFSAGSGSEIGWFSVTRNLVLIFLTILASFPTRPRANVSACT